MARIGVEIVADATKLLKAFSQSAKASNTFTKQLTVDSRISAEAQVKAAVKISESLRVQAAEYHRVANAAQKGSAEQVAATRLAERAEQNLARSMGVTAAESTHLERSLSRAGRGALSGTGIFHTFGRSLAFASGGFLAFEGVSKFLTDSVNAAREAGVANRSLAAQMKASGESFRKNRDQIEKVSLSYGKFGFQNDEVVASLTVLERGTGSITQAMKLQGLTADLARAKNIDLAAAATVVAKVFGGQETALRRAVPGLHKTAHGYDLIREAQQKLAGQAAANTTSTEKFAAALHNTQEIIGTALLPILNKYLNSLSKWLNNTENQKKVQKDVTGGVKVLTGVLNVGIHSVEGYTLAWKAWSDLMHKIGGRGLNEAALRAQLLPPRPDVPGIGGPVGKPGRPSAPGGPQGPIGVSRVAPPLSLQGRFNIQELKLAQAQLTATLADDRRILVVEKAITEKQIEQTKNLKKKTDLTKQLAGIMGQILSIDQQAADAAKQAAEAAKARTQALRDQADAIKSAVIDRLQNKQTGVLNQRALSDALAALHTAQLLGGPQGLKLARQGVADARFAIRLAQLQAAPAGLTKGGQFTLGNTITVNVHGVTDPDKVAAAVVAIIKRQGRHTSTQTRGPTPGGR